MREAIHRRREGKTTRGRSGTDEGAFPPTATPARTLLLVFIISRAAPTVNANPTAPASTTLASRLLRRIAQNAAPLHDQSTHTVRACRHSDGAAAAEPGEISLSPDGPGRKFTDALRSSPLIVDANWSRR
jgi:hypothetical protein